MANEKRLIDAEKFLQWVVKRFKCVPLVGSNYNDQEDMRLLLTQAPTVDAVEVVHAEWIDEYPYVRCSECNAEWINCRTDNEPKLFYYCPNCGAKMDGGNEDG